MNHRRKFLISVFLVVCLPILVAVIAFVVHYVIELNNKEEVSIANMSSYLQKNNYNKEDIERMQNRLYETIKYNVSDDVNIKSLDIVIRDGSYTESFDEEKDVRKVNFIVDIEEIKQSYGVKLEWDEEKNSEEDSQADEWGTEVYCLDKKELIFGDFNCKDYYTYTYGTNDPLIKVLPHVVPNNYSIYLLDDGNGNVSKIKVDIYGCMDKYATPSEEEANAWLAENVKNLADYKIEYSYCNGGR